MVGSMVELAPLKPFVEIDGRDKLFPLIPRESLGKGVEVPKVTRGVIREVIRRFIRSFN